MKTISVKGIKVNNVSDENQELLDEVISRIINEDFASRTGNMDFDINSSGDADARIVANLSIEYDSEDMKLF